MKTIKVKDALHDAIFKARVAKEVGNRENLTHCREFIRKYYPYRNKTYTLK